MGTERFLKSPHHDSYRLHRRQWWLQIVLPLLIGALILVVAVVGIARAAFQPSGDAERWAAVATMWLLAPLLLIGLLKIPVLIAVIYGLARLLAILPRYTGQAQRLVRQAAQRVKGGADASVKPVFALESFLGSLRRLLRWR